MNRQKIISFSRLVHETYRYPREVLLQMVKAKDCYSLQRRAAALRHLVRGAPLEVTGGRPFAESRRRVRKHYGI